MKNMDPTAYLRLAFVGIAICLTGCAGAPHISLSNNVRSELKSVSVSESVQIPDTLFFFGANQAMFGAIGGGLGSGAEGGVALLISQSGATAELEPVIDHFAATQIPIIAITGNRRSMLGEAAAAPLVLPHWPEVGPEAVAPTTSTTMTLALGDALAMTVMREKGFTRTDFGRLHPGGALGARLKPVRRLMHGGEQLPLVTQDTNMHDTVLEMSAKRLGVVGVTDEDGQLVGVITDGDLRRHIEQGLDNPASVFMTANPKTIAPDSLVDDALTLFDEHRITTLFVVDDGKPVGVLHIHDCPAAR